jgi:hypothetical protein
MTMEDAKLNNKDIYVMYADFKGAFNAADHRSMFKHMRQLGMPSTFVDTCEHLYGVSTTDYITPHGPTPSIDINRGTYRATPSPHFYLPSSLNPSFGGSRWAAGAIAQALLPLTSTPHNPQPRTQDTASPTTSALPWARHPT